MFEKNLYLGDILTWGKNIISHFEKDLYPRLLPINTEDRVHFSNIHCGEQNVYAILNRRTVPGVCFTDSNPPTIRCGTLDAIMECIFDIDYKYSEEYKQILLIAWKDITTPQKLMESLEKMFFLILFFIYYLFYFIMINYFLVMNLL